MKIGLFCDAFLGWQGGRDVFGLVLESLQAACTSDDQIAIEVHRALDTLPWRLARLGKHMLTRYPWDRGWMAQEIARIPKTNLLRQEFGRSVKVEWLPPLESHSDWLRMTRLFDVIGPLRSAPPDGGCMAWIGFITDCQHKKLPHFFSAEECTRRDREYSELLHHAPVVIVNSRDTKADLVNYYSPTHAEIVALPFAAAPKAGWFAVDGEALRKKYGIPLKYFLCSNQFWVHKNHAVIFDALAVAKAEGRSHCVVFTGDLHDLRGGGAAGHFQRLVERAKELGVFQNCHFIGLVPKLDQIALMRSAVAVIQPTLFEGSPGGLAVYDAIAVGQRVILSDIPINWEIRQWVDEYFAPADARALFLAMCRLEEQRKPRRAQELLLLEGQERRYRCGQVLRSTFALAIERSNNGR